MKISSFLIILSLFIVSLVSAQEDGFMDKDQLKTEGVLIEAKKEFLIGQTDKAIALLEKLLKKEDNNSVAHYELARIYFVGKKDTEALKHAKLAAELDPSNKWFLLLLADIYNAAHDYENSIIIYQKLQDVDGFQKQYVLNEVSALMHLSKPKKALRILNKYEEKHNNIDPQIRKQIISIYARRGESKKELKSIQDAIQEDPDNMSWLLSLANYYKRQGQKDEAKSVYQRILKKDPNNKQAAYGLARYPSQSGSINDLESIISNPEIDPRNKIKLLVPFLEALSKDANNKLLSSALEDFGQTLINLHGDQAITWAFLADIQQQLNKNDKALTNYQKALDIDKSIFTVWEQTLNLLNRSHKFEELNVYSERAMDYYPNKSIIYFMNGLSNMHLGKLKQAEQMTKESLLMSGRNRTQKANSYQLLGLIYFKQSINYDLYPVISNISLYSKALKHIDKAFALQKPSPLYLDDLVFIIAHKPESINDQNLFVRGIPIKDLKIDELLEELNAISTKSPKRYLTNGILAYKDLRYEEAIKSIEASLDPNDPYYKEALILLLKSAKAMNNVDKIKLYNSQLNIIK